MESSFIAEHDSVVKIKISISEPPEIDIDVKSLDLKVSSSLLANIGPFAEFDPPEKSKAAKEPEFIPEISIGARQIKFTIEPDNDPVHPTSISAGQPTTISIPQSGINVKLKISPGRVDIIKLVQEEVLASKGDRDNMSIASMLLF